MILKATEIKSINGIKASIDASFTIDQTGRVKLKVPLQRAIRLAPKIEPRAKEPQSPMKIEAGLIFRAKNPKIAPKSTRNIGSEGNKKIAKVRKIVEEIEPRSPSNPSRRSKAAAKKIVTATEITGKISADKICAEDSAR